jgi:hypothetical protein
MVSVLLVVTVGALVALSYFQVLRVSERTTGERLRLLSRQFSETLGRGPGTAVTDLSRIAADPSVVGILSGRIPENAPVPKILETGFRGTARRAIAIVNPAGRIVMVKGSTQDSGWFGPEPDGTTERRKDAGPELGSFQRLGDSTLYYDIRVPVRAGDSTIGVLVERFRVAGSTTTRTTLTTLLGASTTLMIGVPGDGVWTDLGGPVSAPPPEALDTGVVSKFSSDSETYLGYAAPVANSNWTLVVRTPESQMRAPARVFLRTALLFAGIAIALGALGAVAVGRRINRPLRDITEATELIASGNFCGRADESSPGEIGRLARSFNAMANQVGASTQKLSESEASHRAFVSHSSQGIWRLEFPGGADITLPAPEQVASWYQADVVADCNPVLAEMYGLEGGYELVHMPLSQLYPPDDLGSMQVLQAFIARGHRCSGVETREQHNTDATRIFTHDLIGIIEEGRLRRIWGTRRDVTVERSLDERIAQGQRLESVGRLAGGIAHDFNNLLTVILADTESIQGRLGPEDGELREIEAAARRAAELTRQLLAFSRGQVLRPTVLDLNAVLFSFQSMLRRVIGEDIDLRLRLGEGIEPVEADAGQIERVVMNLVVNARDAMPSGGTLELRTESVNLDEDHVRARHGVRSGRHVLLAVSDTGTGMSEEVRRKAFEPFFTTKPKGRGTGLGLASVYGVVRQSGGDINIYSEPGRGTTVKIYLPAAVDAAVVQPATVDRHHAASDVTGATVLLVEDDPAVRKMVARSLGVLGYKLVESQDGEAAIKAMEAADGKIDLVLTDMVMPGMSGPEMVKQLRARWPHIGVVMMSGYSGDSYAGTEPIPSDVGFIEKPFAVADLRRTIRTALDGRGRVDGAT